MLNDAKSNFRFEMTSIKAIMEAVPIGEPEAIPGRFICGFVGLRLHDQLIQ